MVEDELPREVDRAFLEVLAEREVAEHLEEREVERVEPTSSMSGVRKTFCDRGEERRRRLLAAQEVRPQIDDELVGDPAVDHEPAVAVGAGSGPAHVGRHRERRERCLGPGGLGLVADRLRDGVADARDAGDSAGQVLLGAAEVERGADRRGDHGRGAGGGPERCGRGAARFANSHSRGRVSRGSMISSTRNASAVLNGRLARGEPRLDLGAQRVGIGGRFELRLVRGLDPALEREPAPLPRRPREPVREARRVLVRGAGDAVHLAHDHRAPRHRRLVDRGERPGAVADRRRLLGLGADDEAGVVDEVHDRETERVGEIDEALTFCDASAVQPPA